MNTEEKRERIRLIFQRRIRALIKSHGIPALNRRRMVALTSRLPDVVGEYVSDADLRVLIRLTSRGLLD